VIADVGELLASAVGAGRVIRPGDDRLADYARDESPPTMLPPDAAGQPDCAVLCETADEVAEVLRICAERRVPVTPRGAGSGMVGGALPVRGGVVLSTERMQRIVEIAEDDLVCVVEPGVITGRLQEAVEARGLFYPPDPASLELCSIGGNAATNAGGPRAFQYGVTRDYVLGLEVALVGGERLRCGRRTAKGVTGYDLVAGFVGSEGTFGVTTELTLKLVPLPPGASTVLAVFADVAAAGAAIEALLRRGIRPRALELADRLSIDHIRSRSRYRFPDAAGAIVLCEVDGDPDGLDAVVARIGADCERHGALDVLAGQSPADRRALWDARRSISRALRDAHRVKLNEDVCVPRGAIAALLGRIGRISAALDLPIAAFGHAGDGNLHVNVLTDDDPADPAVRARLDEAIRRLFADTIDLRGTLSGEHGIGVTKRDFMPLEHTERVIEWQRRWKRMWDPLELLNPGKVLPGPRAACTE
jgi:glycolate oxidase